MAGIENEVIFGSNVDFSGGSPISPQITADGQLLIGSGTPPNIRVGTLTAGSNISIVNSPGGITINSTASGSGRVVQQVRSNISANFTTSNAIPVDNTIPQITEGAELLTAPITPTNAANILLIEFSLSVGAVSTPQMTAALFVDATANALAAFPYAIDNGTYFHLKFGRYFLTAASTSARTYRLRVGPTAGGTAIINPSLYGGVEFSSLTVTEIEA